MYIQIIEPECSNNESTSISTEQTSPVCKPPELIVENIRNGNIGLNETYNTTPDKKAKYSNEHILHSGNSITTGKF